MVRSRKTYKIKLFDALTHLRLVPLIFTRTSALKLIFPVHNTPHILVLTARNIVDVVCGGHNWLSIRTIYRSQTILKKSGIDATSSAIISEVINGASSHLGGDSKSFVQATRCFPDIAQRPANLVRIPLVVLSET